VGVQKALEQSGFDDKMFYRRGGFYDWTRSTSGACAGSKVPEW
jgi:hypothetical protein